MTFPVGQYGVIYMDPPWRFENYSEAGEEKNASAQYDCMDMKALTALLRDIVVFSAAEDCVCFMWATFPMLPQAFELMEAIGFQYKTGGAWHKKTSGGKTAFGTGYVLRSAAEPFLIGTRGQPRIKNRSTRNLIEAVAREHSRKPDETVPLIENLFDGPYLELFARTTRPGWTCWGNQTDKFSEAA